jgi:uncharacterized protein (TIGR03086 family)
MTDPHRSVVVLSRALDQAGDALAAIHPDQLDRPTPCGDWRVRDLAAHLVATPGRFLQMERGEDVDWSTTPPLPEESWAAVFRADADDLIHHWHQHGGGDHGADRDDEDPGGADFQSAELAVHTWDLVRATGQQQPLDGEVAERGLALMQQGLTDDNRGAAFGPEVDADRDAPPYDRLVAFAGRDPGWQPGS